MSSPQVPQAQPAQPASAPAPASMFPHASSHAQRPAWSDLGAITWQPLASVLFDTQKPQQEVTFDAPNPVLIAQQQRLQEAFEKAYQDGVARAKAEYNDKIKAYGEGLAKLTALRHMILQQSEGDVVKLALHIAQEVVQADVAHRRDFTTRMVKECMHMLSEADDMTLRISPEDLPTIMKEHPEVKTTPHVRVVEDASIALGGVIADCAFGRIDATLDGRLRDMRTRLLQGNAGSSKG